MRFLSTITLILLLSFNASAQTPDFFVERNGGYVPDRLHHGGGVVRLNDSIALFFYDLTDQPNGYNSLKVDTITTSGEYVGSVFINSTDDQTARGISLIDNGDVWLLATVNQYEGDNDSDLRLVQLSNGVVTNDYIIDNYRYERASRAIRQTGEQTISFLVATRDSNFTESTVRLLSFDLQSGELSQDLPLPGLPGDFTVASLTLGAEGKMMAVASNPTYAGIAMIDLATGAIDALVNSNELPTVDCTGDRVAPLSLNYLYDAGLEVYLGVNKCLEVYHISQDGTVDVRQTLETTGLFSDDTPSTLRQDALNNWLLVYNNGVRHVLTPWIDGDYFQVGILSPGGGGNSEYYDGLFFEHSRSGNVRVSINNDTFVTSMNVNHYNDDIYNQIVSIATSRSLIIGDDEIAASEFFFPYPDVENLGGEVRYYNHAGELEDSVEMGGNLYYFFRDFALLSDNSYVTALWTGFQSDGQLNLIKFDRETGMSDTLYSFMGTASIISSHSLASGPGDRIYVDRYYRNDENLIIHELSILDAQGNLLVEVPLQSYGSYYRSRETLSVDEIGSAYLVAEPSDLSAFSIHKFDSTGTLIYQVEHEADYPTGFATTSTALNEAGTKFLVAGSSREADGRLINIVYEFDATSGEQIRTIERPGAALSFQRSANQAIYQPGSDDHVLLFYTAENDPLAAVDERYILWMDTYENGDLVYEHQISTTYNPYSLNDVDASPTSGVFLCGSISEPMEKAQQSVLIGTPDFAVISSVEEAPNLSPTAELSIFPNPTAALIRAQWDHAITGAYQLELVNNKGRLISRWRGTLATGRAVLSLDLGHLPGGSYLLRLVTDGRVSTQKIIKQ